LTNDLLVCYESFQYIQRKYGSAFVWVRNGSFTNTKSFLPNQGLLFNVRINQNVTEAERPVAFGVVEIVIRAVGEKAVVLAGLISAAGVVGEIENMV
jgi:hypothetical protein